MGWSRGRRVLSFGILALTGMALFAGLPAQAHRSGCHRWHSCPSDRGTYTCGDLGYPCKYPTFPSGSVTPSLPTFPRLQPAPQVRGTSWPSPAPVVSQVSPTPTTWTRVAHFSGVLPDSVATFNTEPFSIKGGRWRVRYAASGLSLHVSVEEAPGTPYCFDSFSPAGEGTSVIYCGPGTYYFNLIGLGPGSYSLVVEDLRPEATGKVLGAQTGASLAKRINAIFRSVYGRDPTPSENRYWLSRIKDKPMEQVLKDAMRYHKAAGLRH